MNVKLVLLDIIDVFLATQYQHVDYEGDGAGDQAVDYDAMQVRWTPHFASSTTHCCLFKCQLYITIPWSVTAPAGLRGDKCCVWGCQRSEPLLWSMQGDYGQDDQQPMDQGQQGNADQGQDQ